MLPWTVLGIEQEGASERDVKRAYARLLKQHRPEDDPAGFQRLHTAYQRALAILAREKNAGVAAHVTQGLYPTTQPEDLETRPTPQPTVPIFEEPPLDANEPPPFAVPPTFAQPPTDPSTKEASAPNFAPPPQFVPPPPRKPTAELPPELIVKDIDIEEVLQSLERDDDHMPMRVLDAVLLHDRRGLRIKLAKRMLEDSARFSNAASVRFATRLAMLLAFRNSHLTERLMNMIFQIVPASERDRVLAGPNWLLDIAPEFKATINKGHWDFWCAAISNPNAINWDSKLAGFALGEADRLGQASPLGYWDGYDLLDEIVPPARQLWNLRRTTESKTSAYSIHRKSKKKRFKIPPGAFLLVVAVLLMFNAEHVMNLYHGITSRISESMPPPTTAAVEPGWTQYKDVRSFFVDAETQESMNINEEKIIVIGKRSSSGSFVYSAVLENYVRDFPTRAAYDKWKMEHGLATNTPPIRTRNQMFDEDVLRGMEILRERNQRQKEYQQIPSFNPFENPPRKIVPDSPIDLNPSSFGTSHPSVLESRTPGRIIPPTIP